MLENSTQSHRVPKQKQGCFREKPCLAPTLLGPQEAEAGKLPHSQSQPE